MIKLLFNIAIIVGLYYLFRELFRAKKPVEKPQEREPRDPNAELLVEDPQCGLFVPVSQSVKGAGDARFCSEECKRAWERANG